MNLLKRTSAFGALVAVVSGLWLTQSALACWWDSNCTSYQDPPCTISFCYAMEVGGPECTGFIDFGKQVNCVVDPGPYGDDGCMVNTPNYPDCKNTL